MGFVPETSGPPRSADENTKCFALCLMQASIRAFAWSSSVNFPPGTVTQNTPSIARPMFANIGSGVAGSPTTTVTFANASRDFARGESELRVSANMWIGEEGEVFKRQSRTAPP